VQRQRQRQRQASRLGTRLICALRSALYALRSTLYALEAVDRWNCSLSLLFQENDGPGVLLISALLPLPQIDSLWLFMKLYQ
jgi:hypothetical protein